MAKLSTYLNPNRTQRLVGFCFLGVYLGIFIFYLLFDGWLYEWLAYGYDGHSQHFDFQIFTDMQWDLIDGERVYYSTNNLHNFIYMCLWTGMISTLALITGNKFLRQGSVATLAFPIMSTFSTINPVVAREIFTWDIFYYHSYALQVVYDINHLSGIILGIYNYHLLNKDNEEINFKQITPTILFTWVLYFVARILLQKWPFWDPAHQTTALFSINQINDMPFYLFGLEYGLVVGILYGVNFALWKINPHFKDIRVKTFFPFVIFATLTIIFVASGLIILQEIPGAAFIQ